MSKLLDLAPSLGLIVCAECDATTLAPEVGTPAGWDAAWSHVRGWVFTCPACLDAIEDIYRGGGTLAQARRSWSGGLR